MLPPPSLIVRSSQKISLVSIPPLLASTLKREDVHLTDPKDFSECFLPLINSVVHSHMLFSHISLHTDSIIVRSFVATQDYF